MQALYTELPLGNLRPQQIGDKIYFMNEPQQEQPFKVLGEKLKTIRQKMHESVAEVSGAVEIDEQSLQRIEQGKERPTVWLPVYRPPSKMVKVQVRED